MVLNICNAVGYRYTFKIYAITECGNSNNLNTDRYTVTHILLVCWITYYFRFILAEKDPVYIGVIFITCRNIYCFKTCATKERIRIYILHAFRYRYAIKAYALIKSTIPDNGNTVRYAIAYIFNSCRVTDYF